MNNIAEGLKRESRRLFVGFLHEKLFTMSVTLIYLTIAYMIFPMHFFVTVPALTLLILGVMVLCSRLPALRRWRRRIGIAFLGLAALWLIVGITFVPKPLFVYYEGLGKPWQANFVNLEGAAKGEFTLVSLTDPVRAGFLGLLSSLIPEDVSFLMTKRNKERVSLSVPMPHHILLENIAQVRKVPGAHYNWLCVPSDVTGVSFELGSVDPLARHERLFAISVPTTPQRLVSSTYIVYPSSPGWEEVEVEGSVATDDVLYACLLSVALRRASEGLPVDAFRLLLGAAEHAPSRIEKARTYGLLAALIRNSYSGNWGRLQALPLFHLARLNLFPLTTEDLEKDQTPLEQWLVRMLTREYLSYEPLFKPYLHQLGHKEESRDFEARRDQLVAAYLRSANQKQETPFVDELLSIFDNEQYEAKGDRLRPEFSSWRGANPEYLDSLARTLAGNKLLALYERTTGATTGQIFGVAVRNDTVTRQRVRDEAARIRVLRKHLGRLPERWQRRYSRILSRGESVMSLVEQAGSLFGEIPEKRENPPLPMAVFLKENGLGYLAGLVESMKIHSIEEVMANDSILTMATKVPSDHWVSPSFREWFALRGTIVWMAATDSSYHSIAENLVSRGVEKGSTFMLDEILSISVLKLISREHSEHGLTEVLGGEIEDLLLGKRERQVKIEQIFVRDNSTNSLARKKVIEKLKAVRSRIMYYGDTFAEMAVLHSDDPMVHKNGGMIGWFRRDDLKPELREAVFGLALDQISEPIATAHGVYLVRILDKTGDPEYETVSLESGWDDVELKLWLTGEKQRPQDKE